LCTHIKITLRSNRGSPIPGIATNSFPARLPNSVVSLILAPMLAGLRENGKRSNTAVERLPASYANGVPRRAVSPVGGVNDQEDTAMIKVGDKLPEVTFMAGTAEGPKPMTTQEVFGGKTVALFAVPGAFTPTCSAKHLPSFRDKKADLAAKGVDAIACVSVNDAFVMKAWGADQQVGDSMLMLGDGNGEFTKAVGLEMDAGKFGMGLRSQRYSMLVKDGVVAELNVEQGGEYKVSSAEYLLGQL
jgi:peroxiredoxin